MFCKKSNVKIFISLITSIMTIFAVAAFIFAFLDRKKKREERELEKYLDMAII